MIFFKRKPGESLVLNTPNGEIVIRVLDGDELGIDAPAGTRVSRASRADTSGSWLPSRPKKDKSRVA